MASLIQFLEAARTVWRWIVLVAGIVAAYSAYQYQNHQPNLFSGDGIGAILKATKENTNSFFGATVNQVVGRGEVKPSGGKAPADIAESGSDAPNVNQRVAASGSPSQSRTAANVPAKGSDSRSPGSGAVASAGTGAEGASLDLARTDGGPETDSAPRVRLAFRRLASQFCRANRSLALYYSDRIDAPNGFTATRVGSGVRFPSIDRLTSGRDRSLAEKELEVRLRCDYELTYGAGERADPQRPPFEQWRQATLEHQYGQRWTRIDLSHIPTPDDPLSRGEWYVYTPASQE